MLNTNNINGVNQSILDLHKKVNAYGYFNYADTHIFGKYDAIKTFDGGYALENINVGLGSALTMIDNEVINMVNAPLQAEKILGDRVRALDFYQDTLESTEIQFAGKPSVYSDHTNPNSVGINPLIIRTGHMRVASNVTVGDIENSQLAARNVNVLNTKVKGALYLLMQEMDRVAFFGVKGGGDTLPIYGMLNYPHLNPYISLSSDLNNPNYQTFYNDITLLISELQSQNNHVSNDTEMRLCLTPRATQLLNLEGNMQKTLRVVLKENYPNLTIIDNIANFQGAYNNKSVAFLIAETINDGSDVKNTAMLPYSEIGLMSRLTEKENSISQNISAGFCGAVFKKSFNVTRGFFAEGDK